MKAYLFAAALAILLCTSCAVLCTKPKQPMGLVSAPIDVVIDHQAGTISPSGLIRKKPGEDIHIQIQRTSTQCFSFNVITAPTNGVTAQAVDLNPNETVPIDVHYDGDPITITIAAYKKNNDCPTLVERKPGDTPGPWEIKVDTAGWDLAFAGAFTADKLTDPSFTLEQSSTTTSSGGALYQVTRIQSDSVRLGSAAMVHLYHTEPDPLGAGGVSLVPFSFGLGVGDNSNVRYLLGTGIRFDKKLFLTVGAVLGPQKTLSNIPKNGLTPDANFLKTNGGTRTAGKLFFSVSYSFIGVGADTFRKPFSSILTPQPSNSTTSGGGGDGSDDPNISVEAKSQAADTYTLVVENTGADAMGAALVHNFPSGVTAKWTVTATGNAVCGELPTDPESSLTRTIDLPKKGKCEYVVKTTGGAAVTDPDKLPTTILVDGVKIFDSNEP